MATEVDWFAIYYYAGGAVLAVLGMWVLYRALWHDRSRGRRRCPKCWYDMSGTPGMTCSECGRTARSAKALFNTRKRTRLALLGLCVLFLGASSTLYPRVKEHGWLSIVPTTVLIATIGSYEFDDDYFSETWLTRADMRWQESLQRRAFHALYLRFQGGNLWTWQRNWLIRKSVRIAGGPNLEMHWASFGPYYEIIEEADSRGWITPELRAELASHALAFMIDSRDHWPIGVPVLFRHYAKLMISDERIPLESDFTGEWMPIAWTPLFDGGDTFTTKWYIEHSTWSHPSYSDGWAVTWREDARLRAIENPPRAADAIPISISVPGFPEYTQTWQWPVQIGGSIDDILTPVKSPALESAMAERLAWDIYGTDLRRRD